MKAPGVQFAQLFEDPHSKRNLRAFAKLLVFLAVMIAVYALLFQLVGLYEGVEYSFVTGLYWTLTVMSTLGFGDITFVSDLGRLFSIVVMMSGVVYLLIVLPFAFIRFFYAPWLEEQMHRKLPRQVPKLTSGHVIVCNYDAVIESFVSRLAEYKIPYFVIESDPSRAALLDADGIPVILGEFDASETFKSARAANARLVVANLGDADNTNITLTVREAAPDVNIVALVEEDFSIDILQLSGASHVLSLKKKLGETLATRVRTSGSGAHIVGYYEGLAIAELPIHETQFIGKSLRDSGLREQHMVHVVGIWDRGRLEASHADFVLHETSVPVIIGRKEHIDSLAESLADDILDRPVIVIGAGKVGGAAARALAQEGVKVTLVAKADTVPDDLRDLCKVVAGDAADLDVLLAAGLEHASSVLLTTNDDAINIYLAVYCRRLNPSLRVISRVTHQRNLEAIHRAGANYALSYDEIGVRSLMSLLFADEMALVNEGVKLFKVKAPAHCADTTIEASRVGEKTGLCLIGVRRANKLTMMPQSSYTLQADDELLLVGTTDERARFDDYSRRGSSKSTSSRSASSMSGTPV